MVSRQESEETESRQPSDLASREVGSLDSFAGATRFVKRKDKKKLVGTGDQAKSNNAFGLVCRFKKGDGKGRLVVG